MSEAIVNHLRQISRPIQHAADLDALIEAIGDSRYVLLGEASHGTSEFYRWRAEISRRLIQEKGFSYIAVEGDWPSCFSLNRYIKQYSQAANSVQDAMQEFGRWPTWMWANAEIAELMEWLRAYNQNQQLAHKIGFYGIDVYSLWESMDEIIAYLERTGSPHLQLARDAFACFDPYSREGQNYGVSASFFGEECEDEVVALLTALRTNRPAKGRDAEAALSAEINALVAVNAERYYRSMVRGGPDSWNIRDHHMVESLERIHRFHGADVKAIVWEHNTHIGDARATDMAEEGMVNVGQLLREKYGEQVFAVGFGTHRGTVIAGTAWGAPMEVMQVPPGAAGSWEDLMHQAGAHNKLLLMDRRDPYLSQEMGHRAIGVVYHPQYEQHGNYVPSIMPLRYDAFIHIDKTQALQPLQLATVLV